MAHNRRRYRGHCESKPWHCLNCWPKWLIIAFYQGSATIGLDYGATKCARVDCSAILSAKWKWIHSTAFLFGLDSSDFDFLQLPNWASESVGVSTPYVGLALSGFSQQSYMGHCSANPMGVGNWSLDVTSISNRLAYHGLSFCQAIGKRMSYSFFHWLRALNLNSLQLSNLTTASA